MDEVTDFTYRQLAPEEQRRQYPRFPRNTWIGYFVTGRYQGMHRYRTVYVTREAVEDANLVLEQALVEEFMRACDRIGSI